MVLLVCGLLLIAYNYFFNNTTEFFNLSAQRVTKVLDKRMKILETYMTEALEGNHSEWLDLKNFPEDMVVYRYMGDSLQSWSNQFSLDNDDISRRLVVQRFANLRYNFVSPLAEADTVVRYLNIGPKWYLVKSLSDSRGCRIIGGLEVRNTVDASSVNGVNPRLHLADRYSIHPISTTGGIPIYVQGRPMMKMLQEGFGVVPLFPETSLMWLLFAFLIVCLLSYAHKHKSIRTLLFTTGALTAIMLVFFFSGYSLQNNQGMFSPSIYADGDILYSLAAVLIINIWLTLMAFCMFMFREEIAKKLCADASGNRLRWHIAGMVIYFIVLILYVTVSFRSLILNSNMSLELYKINTISHYTVFVYLSYIALISSVPVLLQSIRGPVEKVFGRDCDLFSGWNKSLFAIICAAYLFGIFSVLGARKETNKVEIWMNRLAIDRNLGLELQLRKVENAIAADNAIASALHSSMVDYKVILNRITETHMSRVSKDYEVSAFIFRDGATDPELMKFFNERLVGAVPISNGSRFVYSRSNSGSAQYTGLFVYYFPDNGVVQMLIGVNSKSDNDTKGYSFIFEADSPGSVMVAPHYSYAKYLEGKLVSYKGDYPYPTVLLEGGEVFNKDEGSGIYRTVIGNYVHYFNHITEDEWIVISRQKIGLMHYIVAVGLIYLLAWLWLSLLSVRRGGHKDEEKNYYKSRVKTLLSVSMVLTLITMGAVVVYFVYKRNDANINKLMASKITTIQSLMANRVRGLQSYKEMANQEMTAILANIGDYTRTDITMYSPGGKLFNTTAPEIFERMILGSRTNPEAYRNIMYSNKRYYIHRERVGLHPFYTMYAPLINEKGHVLAIISAPYTDSGLAFSAEATINVVFVVIVFFILLILTRFMTTKVVDRMFRPLLVMGRKMLDARTEGLEYIIYDKDDEITGLVRAYNLMVHDLSESSKQLAKAEREDAWAEMARQVAHEIKNPLTPMRLKIQHLIGLKARGNPAWEAKFDDVARLLLDTITVLDNTANDFSAFAKLYTETEVPINLDEMAADQVNMFDNHELITIEYYGLKDAWVSGPKPQLTRVFVNLLTNAVQAIEAQQRDQINEGKEPSQGRIVVSLRNSAKAGFYDIVFEDSGPGVKDEYRSSLFRPKFTTKSSGTGLGLSICKKILECSGGEIQYSRSYSLQGACFTIKYPKAKAPGK